jgi:hypothetical protein
MSASVVIEWNGGECPVDPSACVRPFYRAAADPSKGVRIEWPCPAWRLGWQHDGGDDDIVGYAIEDPRHD